MNDVVAIIILIAEILAILQCLQIAFMHELNLDKYIIGILGIDVIIYIAINKGIIPKISSILFYILVFIYCYFKYEQKMIKTMICYIVGISFAGCIEAIVACVFNLFRDILDSNIILLLSSLTALFLVCIIKRCIPILKANKLDKGSKWVFCYIILFGLAYGGLVVDYYMNQSFIKLYAVFILLFLVVIVCYLYRLMQAHAEINVKNHELELQKIYGGVYEDLLHEVRRKQHDYKNQLGAVLSMHMVAKSKDELIKMQREYMNSLQVNHKYDSILTCCNNTILAGYFYYRCLLCEESGVAVDYNIAVDQADCCFPLHEIIEILGILIDNACEKVITDESLDKSIRIECLEDNDRILFSVSNPSEFLGFAEINRLFTSGYSTKGPDRGLGLPRCLELAKKYKTEIKVHNFEYNKRNWIKFSIEIVK